jgi:integrase/recombinase XerD
LLLKFALQEFYDDRELKNVSQSTLDIYKVILNQFKDFCISKDIVNVEDITTNTVKKYLLHCQKELGNNPTSRNSKLRRISALLNYMVEIDVINENPAKKVQKAQEEIRIDVFTDYHIKQMLNYYRRIQQREKAFYSYRDYSPESVMIVG